MKNKFKSLGLFFFFLTLPLLITACDPPNTTCTPGAGSRTQGCDEFKRVNSTVYKGLSSQASLPVFSKSGWHPIVSGEAISTNSSGMAELNFSGCWDGQLFVFKDSSLDFQVATCDQVTYENNPLACVPNGAIYTNGPCPGEYTINTGSARITKTGTVLSVTYLPEKHDVTLVVVLEGSVLVEPVAVTDPLEFGRSSDVENGFFYFTMPDDQWTPIGGLEPRQNYPIPELPPVVEELGIREWMFDVRDQAQQDDLLPPEWPADLGGSGSVDQPPEPGSHILVESSGGPFADPRVQDALLRAVSWPEIANVAQQDNLQITGFISGEPVELLPEFPFDPDTSRQLLAEAGYPDGLSTRIFYPPNEPGLERMAKMMSGMLSDGGFDAGMQEMPSNLDELLARLEQTGEGYIILKRGE